MGVFEVTLECPYCHSMFTASPPDRLHSAFSFEKPLHGSYHGNVVEQELICKNPKCHRSLRIYWYAPMDYFDRV